MTRLPESAGDSPGICQSPDGNASAVPFGKAILMVEHAPDVHSSLSSKNANLTKKKGHGKRGGHPHFPQRGRQVAVVRKGIPMNI